MAVPDAQAPLAAVDARNDAIRRRYRQVEPDQLADELAAGALVVDTRPADQRARDGALPGSVVIDRNVLEWRLDPTSPHRIAEAAPDLRIVVVCSEGFSSTLAVASLLDLGLRRATDLRGGFRALAAAGLVPTAGPEPLDLSAPVPR